MDKSLEKKLKQACEIKFKLSLKEMKSCCVTNEDYMLVKHNDHIFLIIDCNSYCNIVKTSMVEAEDSYRRIPWSVLVNSELEYFHENPTYRGVLWQSLDRLEREFIQQKMPLEKVKEDIYWEEIYSNPVIYQKALKALYFTFPSKDKLVSNIVKIGFNENCEELLINCKKIDKVQIFSRSIQFNGYLLMTFGNRKSDMDEHFIDVYSTEGSRYPDLYNYLIDERNK
tara:strand:- start:1566 stop:2243 length:678 start_codon:yes stop_codon:yes gene_type:complete